MDISTVVDESVIFTLETRGLGLGFFFFFFR